MNTTSKTYTLEISNDGSPWIHVAAKSGINPDTLEISNDGSPWWGLTVAGITTHIKKFIGVVYAHLKKVIGVNITNTKKLEGVS